MFGEMLLIRRAVPEDADAISKLIMDAVHHFLVDPGGKGAELFFASITPQAIRDYINDRRFHYLVADQDANLLGALALRDGRHLFHLFVAPSHQRRGIASSLWDAARSAAAPDAMFLTVNASSNAVAVYQRFGFTTVGPRQEVNGVHSHSCKPRPTGHFRSLLSLLFRSTERRMRLPGMDAVMNETTRGRATRLRDEQKLASGPAAFQRPVGGSRVAQRQRLMDQELQRA